MNIGEGSGIKEKKDRKTVLREKRLKEEKKEKTSRSKKGWKRKIVERSYGQGKVKAGRWWKSNYCESIVG